MSSMDNEMSRVERAHQAEVARKAAAAQERKRRREQKAEAYFAPVFSEDTQFLANLRERVDDYPGAEIERIVPVELNPRRKTTPFARLRLEGAGEAVFHRYFKLDTRTDPERGRAYLHAQPDERDVAFALDLLERLKPGDRVDISQGIHPRLADQKHRIYSDNPSRMSVVLSGLGCEFQYRRFEDGTCRLQFETPGGSRPKQTWWQWTNDGR